MIKQFYHWGSAFVLAAFFAVACSAPVTAREQGGLMGAGLGAAGGALIGSTVGHAAVGALVGGPVGLVAGALIGDQLMAQQIRETSRQHEIDDHTAEFDRLRRENRQMRDHMQ